MGDLDTQEGLEAQQILDKTVKWTERVYDMTDEQIQKYIEAAGKDCNKIFYIEYSYKQIGKTEAWLRNISAKIQDPLTTRREILLQRLHGSSLSPFPQEDMEYLVEVEKKPIDELWLLEYFKFDIYEPLKKKIPYIVSVDCSTGTSGDNNAITILNPYTVKPVAEFESSFIGETMYEKLIIELISTVIPRAVVVIERNSMGDGIIDHLLHSKIRNRLYYDKNRDLVEETMRSAEVTESMLKKQSVMKKYYGVYTAGKSRDDMMAILSRHVSEYKDKFVTHNITRDITRLVRTKAGRIEAGTGFHDDSVMSYLIGLYVYYHGNNLELFGIYKGAQDEELNNSGLKHPEEIDPNFVDKKIIDDAKTVREKEILTEKEMNWDQMMKDAIAKSQEETYRLYKSGNIQNSIYDNSTDAAVDSYDGGGDIPLDFFDELNHF